MKWTEDKIEELRMLYESGIILRDIGQILGISKAAVLRARGRFNIPRRSFNMKWQHPNTTEIDIRTKIQQMYEQNLSTIQIAKTLRLSPATVQKWLKRTGVSFKRSVLRDLKGKTFSFLIVTEYKGYINGKASWLCKCVCGNEITVTKDALIRNHTKSCGCQQYTSEPSHRFYTPELLRDFLEWQGNTCAFPFCENEISKHQRSGKVWHLCPSHNKRRVSAFCQSKKHRQKVLENYL